MNRSIAFGAFLQVDDGCFETNESITLKEVHLSQLIGDLPATIKKHHVPDYFAQHSRK